MLARLSQPSSPAASRLSRITSISNPSCNPVSDCTLAPAAMKHPDAVCAPRSVFLGTPALQELCGNVHTVLGCAQHRVGRHQRLQRRARLLRHYLLKHLLQELLVKLFSNPFPINHLHITDGRSPHSYPAKNPLRELRLPFDSCALKVSSLQL